MSTLMLLTETAQTTVMAGDGILDFLDVKVGEVGSLLRTFSIVAGIGFVVWQAIASRGAMARIVISGLSAAVFVWIVFNVTELSNRVDNEVNAAGVVPAAASQLQPLALPAPPAGRAEHARAI